MKTMNIKRVDRAAQMPFRATDHAFGYDVTATSVSDITRATFEKSIENEPRWKKFLKRLKWHFTRHPRLLRYDLGFVVQPDDKPQIYNRAVIFVPRSSVYKMGLALTNDFGIIDVDEYTGMGSAIFRVVDGNLPHYQVGDRIGQIFLLYSEAMRFVDGPIRETARGSNGYGSTGK